MGNQCVIGDVPSLAEGSLPLFVGNAFSGDELDVTAHFPLPKHIAIIMDGNRRWAAHTGKGLEEGYWQGAEALTRTVKAGIEFGIETMTVFAFSTENWNRSQPEIDFLLHLFENYLIRIRHTLIENDIKLGSIGDLTRFPERVRSVLQVGKEQTAHCKKMRLVLALNYGGRDDIRRAALKVVQEIAVGRLLKENLTEELFATYLDTAMWGDPDLVIRTSGEQRMSNFLLWQSSYAEMYVTDVFWPDFGKKDLEAAIIEFQRRQRRGGG